MDLNRMTERLQKGILDAQSLAVKSSHQEVDEAHLFLTLLRQEDSLLRAILEKADIRTENVEKSLLTALDKKPQVTGSGAEHGKLYITSKLQQTFCKCRRICVQVFR